MRSEESVLDRVAATNGDGNHLGAPLRVRSHRRGGKYQLALAGELDLSGLELVRSEVSRALGTDASTIVIDLSELAFIDCSAIRLLLELDDRSRQNGNRLRFTEGSPEVERVLELTGADRLLTR